MHTRMAFREKELAVKEAEDEEKRSVSWPRCMKSHGLQAGRGGSGSESSRRGGKTLTAPRTTADVSSFQAAAREAAEAEAQALAAGDEQVVEEKPPDVRLTCLNPVWFDTPQEGEDASVQKLSKDDEDAEARSGELEGVEEDLMVCAAGIER
eukprot:634438-Hanusia_phi.AAC.1